MKKLLSVFSALILIACMSIGFLSVNAATPNNLAISAKATDDPNGMESNVTEVAAKANDGDKKTRWAGNAQIDTENENKVKKDTWLALEFPTEAAFDKVVVDWFQNKAAEKGYKIQSSSDGNTWTDVKGAKFKYGDEQLSGTDKHYVDTITFTATTCKYLRVWIEKAISKDGPSIWEVEAYNTKDPNFKFDTVVSQATSSGAASSTTSAVSSASTSSTANSSQATSSKASTSSNAADSNNSTWIWVIIGIAAAAVIAGVVFFIIKKNKK